VAGHAAAGREDALGGAHPFHVLRVGLFAHQDHLFALAGPLDRLGRGEHDLSDRPARTGRQPARERLVTLLVLGIDDRVEQLVQLGRLDAHHGRRLVDQPFGQHVHGHVQRRRAGPLAVAALEHVELAFLDRELDVLHVLVMRLELDPDGIELLVQLGHVGLQRRHVLVLLVLGGLVERIRGADARHHVLALGIDQPFAVELVLAGGGVAGEGHARGRVAPHVAEDHALHVDGRAPFVGDALDAPVRDGPLAVPALEDRADRAPELGHGIVGKLAAEHGLDLGAELLAEFLEVVGREVGIGLAALGLLHVVHDPLQLEADPLPLGRLDSFGLFHHHVGIHHHQPPVGVVDKPGVVGLLDQPGDRLRAQPDVEHGLHHARHGAPRARARGNQQGVVGIAVLHPHGRFDLLQGLGDLLLEGSAELLPLLEIDRAVVRADGEARRDRKAELGHFRQVRPLSPQAVLHRGIALGTVWSEVVDVFLRHRLSPRSGVAQPAQSQTDESNPAGQDRQGTPATGSRAGCYRGQGAGRIALRLLSSVKRRIKVPCDPLDGEGEPPAGQCDVPL